MNTPGVPRPWRPPGSRLVKCPGCGAAVVRWQLAGEDGGARYDPPCLHLETAGVVAFVPPDPMAEVARWAVRLVYPVHTRARCAA